MFLLAQGVLARGDFGNVRVGSSDWSGSGGDTYKHSDRKVNKRFSWHCQWAQKDIPCPISMLAYIEEKIGFPDTQVSLGCCSGMG